MDLFGAQLMTVDQMAASNGDELQNAIGDGYTGTSIGDDLHSIATELAKVGGVVPTDKAGLLEIGVDETVTRLLMQQVFGSTELVIGLHTRKLVCALDMFDWEESGVSCKKDVKLVKIPAGHVTRSLTTWIPKGDGRTFQETMEGLGAAIGGNQIGFWGTLKSVINKHFSQKDKKELLEMATSIVQFYKATRSGGRRRG